MSTTFPSRLRFAAVPGAALATLLLPACSATTAESGAAARDTGDTSTTADADTDTGAAEGAWGQDAVTDGPRPGATSVVLTFADWDAAAAEVQAWGYVSPVVEEGGTCTLELTADGGDDADVVVTSAGVADATTTVCGGLTVPDEDLAPGSWTAVLRYESAAVSGESEPVTVEVPQ